MRLRTKWIAGGTLAFAFGGGGTGIALATAADNDHAPITGTAYLSATSVALAHTGGGTVTETEVGDEDGYYQIEVTNADGSSIDVNLDRAFHIVATKADGDER